MKNRNINVLKTIRVIIALIVFIFVLLFFIDFRSSLPEGFHALLHLQVVPAIFAGALSVVVALLLLTLLFGRVYCSMLCPAGILQDVFNRLACLRKKKKRGLLRFKTRKPHNVLRYSILAVTSIAALVGVSELCLLLDPYSNFGRIATHIFRPAVVSVNNFLSDILTARGVYTLYNVSETFSLSGAAAAWAALLVFAFMALWRGRLFCNTICPVGSLLSIVSRFSLFRLTVDEAACNKCGVCARSCKAEAIDSEKGTVDMSLCVGCFNCISHCSRNALAVRRKVNPNGATNLNKVQNLVKVHDRQQNLTGLQDLLGLKPELLGFKTFNSRRTFLTTFTALATTAIAKEKNSSSITHHSSPITPPGSQNIKRFKELCTGCHICVARCPSKVLKPAGFQYGLNYALKPYMSYENSFCNYSCTVCAQVCPTRAIKSLTEDEKKVTQIGIAKFHINRCVVHTDENDCGACSEHCPTQAVHMVPYKGTLTIPKVEPELCVGCGGCESICPVRPQRAIIIEANPVHKKVEKAEEEKAREIEINDFGF